MLNYFVQLCFTSLISQLSLEVFLPLGNDLLQFRCINRATVRRLIIIGLTLYFVVYQKFSKLFCILAVIHIFSQKIIPEQHGVMKGRSPETNLCSFFIHVAPLVHSHSQADVAYLDMNEASDKVNHQLLLRKPYKYGLCSKCYRLFESYLSHRVNFLRVASCLSALFFIYFGCSTRQQSWCFVVFNFRKLYIFRHKTRAITVFC